MSRWLDGLNDEQRRAVAAADGPLLVLAGAGSGKTRVITHRIAHLMAGGVAPEAILAVTFTNKAADEMRERLVTMVGKKRAQAATLSTFHAFGLALLKDETKRQRRGARLVVFDTGDQLACLRELLRRVELGRAFDLGALLQRISAWKNAFLAPGGLPASEDPYDEAAAELYPRYLEQLEAYAAVDFDDLVCRPTQLLESSAACRERWAGRFRYVLVDEYQDTNAAQLRLLRALGGAHRNVCVVGDDDQSIYGWRGADVRNILRFGDDFPGAQVIALERNYRSCAPILALANQVIAANPERHPKRLRPTRHGGAKVRLVVGTDGESEARWVALALKHSVERHGRAWGDAAVLYRSNVLARALEEALREHGVPYRVFGGAAFFDRKEVKDVGAYLRLCCNPQDEIALRRAINTPARGIGPVTVAKLAAWAEAAPGRTLFAALTQAPEVLGSGDRALAPIAELVALLGEHAPGLRRGQALVENAQRLVEATGLRAEIERNSASGKIFERRWGHVLGFFDGLAAYCRRVDEPSVADYLNRLALISTSEPAAEGAADCVTLCTLHGAKGLEFPLVIMVGMEEGLLPHDRTINPQANDLESSGIDEERRLCYVGITRARDELVLTRAARRLIRGRLQDRQPSRFLEGLAAEDFELEDLSAPPPLEDVKSMMAALRAQLGGG
ncbi:MAG: UvrD-helicase domain-containing protein [Proteobacteria bacterium]|nr:UvrD-helicase domain-containing protein [Pseudomonadota bacterium]